MPAAIASWRVMPGLRFTSPASVLSVDLEAFTDLKPSILGGEGDVHYVEFTVKDSTGATFATHRKVAREARFPNYSAAASPLPGAPSGSMGLLVAYGITLAMNAIPFGKVTISASVYSQKGTQTNLPDVWLWNDSDGVDRRGTTKTIYVNASTGNDSNAGTIGSPVQTINKAIELVRNNPAGSGLVAHHAGGGEIVCTGAFTGNGSFPTLEWHTDDQWLTIRATPGTTWQRGGSTQFIPARGVANSGTIRLRWVGWEFFGQGCQYYVGVWPSTTVTMHVWHDGFVHRPTGYSASRPWDIRYVDSGGEAAVADGPDPTRLKTYFTCATWEGRGGGAYEFTLVHDGIVGPWLGIAFQTNAQQPAAQICNVLIERQRYITPDIHGLWHSRGTNLVVSVPVAGTMRVTQTGPVIMLGNNSTPTNLPGNPTIELDVQLAQMPGYTAWRYRFSGCANAGNNGDWACTAVGRDGLGRPFADFANASAVAETLSSTARILPARAGGVTWYDVVHVDLLQYNSTTTGSIVSHFAARDIDNSQGIFGSGNTLTRCVVAYATEGGNPNVTHPFSGCVVTDCVFVHNSFAAQVQFSGATVTGCSFEENIFGNGVSNPPSTTTNWWRGNHYVTGGAPVS
jgi:hypothetical protein